MKLVTCYFAGATILSQGRALRLDLSPGNGHAKAAASFSTNGVASESSPALFSAQELKQRERDNILAALEQARWKVYGPGGAAELLGLKPTTLASRMKRLRISRTS
jgi:transcriptional regulator with GAF, ATPase, and Fis domain